MSSRKGKRRRKFSIFNLVNPFWVVSSLASALFRILGIRKQRRRPTEHIRHSNTSHNQNAAPLANLPHSVENIQRLPHLGESLLSERQDKVTQTASLNNSVHLHSQLNSQLGELVRLRRFRNSLKPYRNHVRRIASNKSNDFLRSLDSRNRERFGGKVSKLSRNRTAKMVRSLLMAGGKNAGIDVDEAMEDLLYISDSDE